MGMFSKLWSYFGLEEEEEVVERGEPREEFVPQADSRRNKGQIVGLATAKQPSKMILSEPRTFDDAQEIADHLKARRPVLVNLQRVRQELAVRMVDFLSGTVYALNGSISKVGPGIFICTPDNVEIVGTITEMLEGESDFRSMR
jgi:cell division inhibitor SepF